MTRPPSRGPLRIALLHDVAGARPHPSATPAPDLDLGGTLDAVTEALRADGHTVRAVPVARDLAWAVHIAPDRCDLAVNLCEGVEGDARLESAVAGAVELAGVPLAGSGSWTLALGLRKPAVNALLSAAGLPVPAWFVARRGAPLPSELPGFPAICKPAEEDASIGIEQGSVVRTRGELLERLTTMHARWRDVVVQRFVDGRELNVGIVAGRTLPVAEIDFSATPAGDWRLITYESKWTPGSADDLAAVPVCPANIAPALAAELGELARQAWQLVGGAGYGRVDFRVDAEGRAWILEVNANPDLAPEAGLARMARAAGIDYATLVRQLCDAALGRIVLGPLHQSHRPRIAEILVATAVFRAGEIDVALELFDSTFGAGADASGDYRFLGAFAGDGTLVGYACWGDTPGTDRTFDLYWIAVDPDRHGLGVGSRLLAAVERALLDEGARVLVVETSSRPEYATTREFYLGRQYGERARLTDFYARGDDRVIYTKRLHDTTPTRTPAMHVTHDSAHGSSSSSSSILHAAPTGPGRGGVAAR